MSLIVQKFGGSSVRDAKRLRHVAEWIAETYRAGHDLIVVLSAQGDMTDELLAKAEEISRIPSKRELDMLLSTGEQISVALAVAFKADLCQIFTDVDGVYTADPRVVPEAKKLDEITYNEMLELAAQGAKVLHSRSVEAAKRYHVDLEVLSSLERTPGTKVRESTVQKRAVAGVTRDTDIAVISLYGAELEQGSAERIFALLQQKNIHKNAVFLISEKEIRFSVKKEDAAAAASVLEQYRAQFRIDWVDIERGVAKVSVVGKNFLNTCAAAVIREAMKGERICVKGMEVTESRVTVLLPAVDAERAVRIVHKALFEE